MAVKTQQLGTMILVALALTIFAGCRDRVADAPADRDVQQPAEAEPSIVEHDLAESQLAFWSRLHDLCGQAFEGEVVEDTTGNPDFVDAQLVMHVWVCEEERLLIPFHVGENRSRTWVLTQTETGLRLKHDHRHEDGSEEELTQYGGDTADEGTASRQEFHADAHTAELLPEAATNVWTMEIIPGEKFAYALRREGTDRRFRAEFDLTRPIDPPPLPWGHEEPERD